MQMLYARLEIYLDHKSSWNAKKYPNNIEVLELDLLKENSENTLSDLSSDKPIDILINNAGVGNSNQQFGSVSSKPWVELLKVNFNCAPYGY